MRLNKPALALVVAGAGLVRLAGAAESTTDLRAPTVVPDVEYILRAGLAYSDNLFRAPAGLEAQVGSAAVGAELHGERDMGRLTYQLAADLSHYEYFEDYDSQTFGRARVEGNYAFVPDFFSWNALVAFDQVRDDLTRPLAPGNIDDQFSWSTGPEMNIRLGNTMAGYLEAHYQSIDYSESDLGSDTVGGRVMLQRRANPSSMLAIGGSYDDVMYEDDAVSGLFDFTRTEAFARVEKSGARTGVAAEVGYAQVEGDFVDDSGPVFRGTFSRQLSPTLYADVSYVHEYPTSSATSYVIDPTVPGGGNIDNSTLTAAPRIADSLDASLAMRRPRTEARLGYTWRQDDSLIEVLGKRDYNEIRFGVTRRFTPKADGSFYAARSQEDYSAFPDEFKETTLGGQLSIMFGRSVGLDLRVEYRDHDSNEEGGDSQELSWGLFVRYQGAFGRRSGLADEEELGL